MTTHTLPCVIPHDDLKGRFNEDSFAHCPVCHGTGYFDFVQRDGMSVMASIIDHVQNVVPKQASSTYCPGPNCRIKSGGGGDGAFAGCYRESADSSKQLVLLQRR
ncbi:hypothetical protein UFOVP75_220 [uncultured Caudovirales phage]|uniref:Uncharacterized protein n=1 Tax=uncultured Caudovirales phage TaxID=2100421 RepID=A0A6J5L1G2_9CAUD|nr:hypothetical protein UFOVP75_220 [uncultured Caudovirales phage]